MGNGFIGLPTGIRTDFRVIERVDGRSDVLPQMELGLGSGIDLGLGPTDPQDLSLVFADAGQYLKKVESGLNLDQFAGLDFVPVQGNEFRFQSDRGDVSSPLPQLIFQARRFGDGGDVPGADLFPNGRSRLVWLHATTVARNFIDGAYIEQLALLMIKIFSDDELSMFFTAQIGDSPDIVDNPFHVVASTLGLIDVAELPVGTTLLKQLQIVSDIFSILGIGFTDLKRPDVIYLRNELFRRLRLDSDSKAIRKAAGLIDPLLVIEILSNLGFPIYLQNLGLPVSLASRVARRSLEGREAGPVSYGLIKQAAGLVLSLGEFENGRSRLDLDIIDPKKDAKATLRAAEKNLAAAKGFDSVLSVIPRSRLSITEDDFKELKRLIFPKLLAAGSDWLANFNSFMRGKTFADRDAVILRLTEIGCNPKEVEALLYSDSDQSRRSAVFLLGHRGFHDALLRRSLLALQGEPVSVLRHIAVSLPDNSAREILAGVYGIGARPDYVSPVESMPMSERIALLDRMNIGEFKGSLRPINLNQFIEHLFGRTSEAAFFYVENRLLSLLKTDPKLFVAIFEADNVTAFYWLSKMGVIDFGELMRLANNG